ncbi:MAG: putative hemolysin [Roseivirga sp.]
MAETSTKYIDIKAVIKGKNPALAKWLPSFVVNYIKRIIHQDEINHVMTLNGDKVGLDFVRGSLETLKVKIEVEGLENIPNEGGFIMSSNHPLGGLDGFAFMKAVGEVREDFQFLVNDILLNVGNLSPLFIPVNKVGSNARAALKVIDETYSKEIPILVFPAGMVSRMTDEGEITDLVWQKSFIAKAKSYKKDVIPVHISGENSRWFNNVSRWRTKLGIKANLEMFYLVDELFKKKNSTIKVTIGKGVSYADFDKSRNLNEWAMFMREKTYALAIKK